MAPEMIEEDSLYNEKIDIYSFGILLYEILTRRHPYYELKHRFEVIDYVLAGNRPTIIEEEIPFSVLRKLVKSCWQKIPRKRPSWSIIS